MRSAGDVSRRTFLTGSSLALVGLALQGDEQGVKTPEPVIDIHQHLNYSGRSDAALLAHQRAMGATTTILLPAGRSVTTASTHQGVSNGLQAEALGNVSTIRRLAANQTIERKMLYENANTLFKLSVPPGH